MTHEDLINTLLTAHGAIAGVAIVVFYNYSDRTDGFGASLKGISGVLTEMRRQIAADLSKRLEPIFQSPGSVPSPLLDPNGDTYIEHSVNPVGSESYREALRDFLDCCSESMSDYRCLTIACKSWCCWANTFSWIVFGLVIWQIIALGLVFLDKVSVWALTDKINCALWIPTVAAILGCAVAITRRFLHFNKMTKLRIKYGEL